MPDRVDPTVPDTPGGEQRVEAAAVRLAMELGHTMQSVEPMRAAPNTVRIARNVLLSADAVDSLRSPATTDDRADAELAERMEAIRESEREAWHDSTPANPRTFSEEYVRSLTESLTAKEREVVELEKEIERLRRGVPHPGAIRFGIEAEPWEGNGPCMDCEGRSPFWHAENEMWDAVMGEGEHDPPGVICPVCFIIRAWKKDVPGWNGQWWFFARALDVVPAGDLLQEREMRRDDRAAIARLVEAFEFLERETRSARGSAVVVSAVDVNKVCRAALDSLPPSLKVTTEEGEGGE